MPCNGIDVHHMNAPESALLESMPAAETGAVCAVTGNVEAARYALFSRIVPVLLHGLVGDLQAMRFAVSLARLSCETAESREKILGAIARIGEQTNAAVVRGQAFADWLRPDTDAKTIVHEAVRANLDLIATEWSLRGIEVTTDDAAAIQVVGAAMCREMLSAMLVTLGDSLPGAADVKLRLRQRAGVVVVSLHGRAAAREAIEYEARYPARCTGTMWRRSRIHTASRACNAAITSLPGFPFDRKFVRRTSMGNAASVAGHPT